MYLPFGGVRESFLKMRAELGPEGCVPVNLAREADGGEHFKRGRFGVPKVKELLRYDTREVNQGYVIDLYVLLWSLDLSLASEGEALKSLKQENSSL